MKSRKEGDFLKKLVKKICLVLSLTLMSIINVACNKESNNDKEKSYETQLIPNFEKGFRLTGYDSRYPEYRDIGRLPYGQMAEHTDWRIGQWGCNKNLIDSVHRKEGNTDIFFDGSKTLKINNDTGGFTLDVDGSKDYTKDREEGEEWIHYILEVPSFPTKV